MVVINDAPAWTVVAIMVSAVLAGCVATDPGPDESEQLPQLSLGTTIEVLQDNVDGAREKRATWSLESVETRMGGYGADERLASFHTEEYGNSGGPAVQYYDLETKDISLVTQDGTYGKSADTAADLCFIPLPVGFAVLLSGITVPTVGQPQSVMGLPFQMDLVSNGTEYLLTLSRGDRTITADVTLEQVEDEIRISLLARAFGPELFCDPYTTTAQMVVRAGDGEIVPFQSGVAESPHEAQQMAWPPPFDIPSASFPLQDAVSALERDPRFQEFVAEGEIWPVLLNYRDHTCATDLVPTWPTWQWQIVVVREDGKALDTCVVVLKGTEAMGLEIVYRAEPGTTVFPDDRVEVIDFSVLDEAVEGYAEGQTGSLSHFWFSVASFYGAPEDPAAWINLQRADPEEENIDYMCTFNGSTGRIGICIHAETNIPVCPPQAENSTEGAIMSAGGPLMNQDCLADPASLPTLHSAAS